MYIKKLWKKRQPHYSLRNYVRWVLSTRTKAIADPDEVVAAVFWARHKGWVY